MPNAAGWTEQVVIPIRKRNGTSVNVLGMLSSYAPGLAIVPAIGTDADVAKYSVTHIASGLKVGLFNDLDAAKSYLVSIVAVADWTLGGEQLRADRLLAERIWSMRIAAPGSVVT